MYYYEFKSPKSHCRHFMAVLQSLWKEDNHTIATINNTVDLRWGLNMKKVFVSEQDCGAPTEFQLTVKVKRF